ncbi:MAG: hypothetical protein AAF328_00475 [Planctomycetota bacterium]
MLLWCLMGQASYGQLAQPTEATRTDSLPQLVGFDVPVPHLDDLDRAKVQLDRVVELGVNAVRFVVPLYQPHAGSRLPRLDQRPGRGPTDADLLSLIEHARKLGLHTVVTPRIAFTRPQRDERVADISPPQWEAWWVAYAQGVTHYAQLSERSGVDVFGLADGLDSALDPLQHVGALNRWDALIADVRDSFAGALVVWAAPERAAVVADALDLDWIAVRPPALAIEERDLKSESRRTKAMARYWKLLNRQLRDAQEDQHRPVALVGIGLPARPDGWSGLPYAPFSPAVIDEEVAHASGVQSEALRGFLSVWQEHLPAPPGSGDRESLAGVFLADWRLDREGGPFDPSHAMQGKPAEAILRRYFSGNHQ